MDAHWYLHFGGLLLTFLLKVTAGFLLCLGLVRLLRTPRHRFAAWWGFLLVSLMYWTELIWGLIAGSSRAATSDLRVPSQPYLLSSNHLVVPASWSGWIATAGILVALSYLAGVLILLCTEAWKHIRLRSLLRQSVEPAPDIQKLFAAMCRDFGVRRCRLAVLPGINSPATAYSWRPCVLIPEVCQDLGGQAQLADVFCHELVHVVRRDYLWATLSDLIRSVLFFHPAVWQARKQMRQQRELACDMAVVEARPDHRADYATSLARFVRLRMLQRRPSYGVDLAESASFLGTRIRCILAEPKKTPIWKKLSAAAAGVVFVSMFGLVSPALSIVVDFAAQPRLSAVSPSPLPAKRPAAHHERKSFPPQPGNTADSGSPRLPDTLTSLRVHNSVEDSPAYALSSSDYRSRAGEPAEMDQPAWRDSSPAAPSVKAPTVGSVVRSTIGGIAVERGEHGGRGHERDGH